MRYNCPRWLWDSVVGCALRSYVRHAAAAITNCTQLCVQVRGLHLLSAKERRKEKAGKLKKKEADQKGIEETFKAYGFGGTFIL